MSIRAINPHRMAMLLFISSEAIFFGALIVTYIVNRTGPGSQAAELFNVPLTLLFSIPLFASSGAVALAHRQIERGSQRRLRFWLLTTVALGLLFLAGQAYEYRHFMQEGFTLGAGSFGSSFYGLTGFHGLHVAAGLLLLLLLWASALSPGFLQRGGPAVDAISLYWHFVDGVWVVILAVVYLWTLL